MDLRQRGNKTKNFIIGAFMETKEKGLSKLKGRKDVTRFLELLK